ncbi:MAG: hypothetical protein H6855_07750 [Rhodospirillales bacterium]|nr:hypothetical protein [Rhodospirillales bacterium]
MTEKISETLANAAQPEDWKGEIHHGIQTALTSLYPGKNVSIRLNPGLADDAEQKIPVTVSVRGAKTESCQTHWAQNRDGIIKFGDHTLTLEK